MVVRLNRLAPALLAFVALVLLFAGSAEKHGFAAAPPKPTPAETDAQKQAAEAQKKAVEALKKQAHEALKKEEVEILKVTYILLTATNDHYEGHNRKAAKAVEVAVKRLDGDAVKALHQQVKAIQDLHKLVSGKLLPGKDGDILQDLSDYQLAHADNHLKHLIPVLANNKQEPVLKDVEEAHKQIEEALRLHTANTATEGREVDALITAYVLLAGTDQDYGGHRVQALKEIEEALNLLDADILKRGTLDQKIKVAKDAHTEALAKVKNKEDAIITEPHVLSDAQLMLADAILRRAAVLLNDGKHPRVLKRVEAANAQLNTALTIR